MAIITVSTNITNSTPGTDALTLASGDTVNLLPNVGIFNYAPPAKMAFTPAARTPSLSTATLFSMDWRRPS